MNGAFINREHNVNANHNIVMHCHGRVIEHGTPHAPCNPYANRLPQAPGAKIGGFGGGQWCSQNDLSFFNRPYLSPFSLIGGVDFLAKAVHGGGEDGAGAMNQELLSRLCYEIHNFTLDNVKSTEMSGARVQELSVALARHLTEKLDRRNAA